MIIENIAAQMLTVAGHNISPIEVKSGKNYTLSSLKKFMEKYKEQLDIAYVLHMGDLKADCGIIYLPLYMTPLL